jgi:hypothetical protein
MARWLAGEPDPGEFVDEFSTCRNYYLARPV